MAKAQADGIKGQSMDQLSDLVKQISNKLKEAKTHLAPQIAELKAVRQQFQQTEGVYLDNKAKYDE